MANINQLQQAMQEGDLQTIDQLLEPFLMNAEPNEQYEMTELFMQYGYLQQANRALEHLQFLFPEEAQLTIDRANVMMEIGEEDPGARLAFIN